MREFGKKFVRRRRHYSRRPRHAGARHLTHDHLGLAFACSMAFHAFLFVGLIRITDAPIGASDIDLLPAVSAFQVSDSRGTAMPTVPIRSRVTRPVSHPAPGRMTPQQSQE